LAFTRRTHYRHPITYPLPLDALAEHTARLWDQVWWLSLPWWRRWYYRLQGYRAPIRMGWFGSDFYREIVTEEEFTRLCAGGTPFSSSRG
jgi:hypothetical protein